ncbi:MAG TPA: hypothetical protein PLJ78_02965 [Anaerolineae bacterium]|nr:hypothetical protein [Anaerolineae bacterium]HQK12888.1 hypothetical protein [Anaerolineae bacterium]
MIPTSRRLRLAMFAGLSFFLIALAVVIPVRLLHLSAAPNSAPLIVLDLGMSHSCALIEGGVRCWGYNAYGQLGTNDLADRPVPVQVSGLVSGTKMIAVGSFHSCALLDTGGVKCWGSNRQGELGTGTYDGSPTPVAVSGLASGVKGIAAGYNHTCAIMATGSVKCWGSNGNGQLGAGAIGGTSNVPVDVIGLDNVTAIAGGGAHTCALLGDGRVKCWGYNYYGSLGNGNTTDQNTPTDVVGLSDVKQIEAGYLHTCALLNTGTVKCWGSFANLWVNTPTDMAGLTNITAIAASGTHLCALNSAGGVLCMGGNGTGQIGDGTTIDRNAPVAVSGIAGATSIAAGGYHNCAVLTDGVRCWGSDARGQLGMGNTSYAWSPLDDITGVNYAAFATGALHVCGITTTGAAKCWGQDYSGELGIGSTTWGVMVNSPQDVVGLSSGVQAIAAGLQYTCAIVNGAAKCWGNNDYGQLGNGTTTDANTPVNVSGLSSGVTAIAVVDRAQGDEHSCAVVNGAAKCWGYNYAGALGNGQKGDATPVTTPVDVVGLSANVTDIAAGADHSCAIVGGSVKCWGFSYYGQLGNGTSGTYDIYPSPVNVIGLPAGATKIVAGNNFNCAIVNGGVWCWGDNEQGQLGSPAWPNLSATPIQASGLESGVTALAATRTKVCAIKEGILYCWGDGQPVPLQNSLYNATYTDVAVSGDVTCVVGATDAVCGGTNVNGKLGDGRVNERLTPVPVLGLKPGPELYMHYAAARPGSLLHITVANAPAWTNVPISLNGQLLGTGQANQYGYFRAVLNTTGALPGYYRVHVLVNGAPLEAAFTLDNAAPLRSLEGGGSAPGILFDMVGGVATPTPAPATPIPPTPTPIPGVVRPAPVINQVFPNQGAADQPAQVEIYGANFQPGASAYLEQPYKIPALRTIYNSPDHLTVQWPGGLLAATYQVAVLNPDWSKGTLQAGYTALDLNPVNPADDLYGFNYELTSNQVYEYVGQPSAVWFVVHRLGGASTLNDVRVRFYIGAPGLTDPAGQATYIGEGSIAALPPNGFYPATVPWTPSQAGYFELYAIIDPENVIPESGATNNMYHRGIQIKVQTPPDTSPPVVDAVTAPLKTSSGSAVLSITAHDVGDSGLAWMDFVVWEYFPSVRAWLVTDETGWMPYDSVYWYSFGYFSGPRYIDVWVADAARNISTAPGSALVNYLKPDNFIMQGESHLYLFPLTQNAAFSADMRFRFTFDDADLYLWPPDYPSRPYWYSANEGPTAEHIGITAPVEGYYWLEVYGYATSFYDLSVNTAAKTTLAGTTAPLTGTLRTVQLGVADEPSHIYRLSAQFERVYLPLVMR